MRRIDEPRTPEARAYRYLYWRKRWLDLRARILAEQPWCAWCAKHGRHVRAEVVHHVTPHRGDVVLFHDPDNLVPLCRVCHDGKAQSAERVERDDQRRGYSLAVGVDGYPLDEQHPDNIEARAAAASSSTPRGGEKTF